MGKYLLFICIALQMTELLSVYQCDKDLWTVSWYGGFFNWPCPATKNIYKNTGKYIVKNIIATRAQIYKDDAFLVLPRFRDGVPATLVKTSLKQKTCQACLDPYPCFAIHDECKPEAIQNAVDLFLDQQDLLWVLDVGIVNTLEQPIQKNTPRVFVFNVKLNKLVKVIDLCGLVVPASRLQYLVVDYTPDGKPLLYISDAAARAIIVYNVYAEKGYRLVLPKAVICGCGNRRDVLYIALIRKADRTTVLYFTYLSGKRLYMIPTEFLRKAAGDGQIIDVGIKPERLVILGTDNGGAIFFRYEGKENIYRWDTSTCFTPNNFVLVYRGDNCLLSTHAMADYKRNRMRLLKSNFPDFIQSTVGCGAFQSLALMENVC